jgi:hypothetical protein
VAVAPPVRIFGCPGLERMLRQQQVPAGMDAGDLAGGAPDRVHRLEVLLVEGAVEGLVSGEDGVGGVRSGHARIVTSNR